MNRRDYTGKNNPNWKGGTLKNGGGYIMEYCPGHPRATKNSPKGYVMQHILRMEKHIGTMINFNTHVVHHKDGNRANNKLKNLELMTKKDHAIEHLKERNFHRTSTITKMTIAEAWDSLKEGMRVKVFYARPDSKGYKSLVGKVEGFRGDALIVENSRRGIILSKDFDNYRLVIKSMDLKGALKHGVKKLMVTEL